MFTHVWLGVLLSSPSLQGSSLTARDLIRALVASLTGGSAIPQQVCACVCMCFGPRCFVPGVTAVRWAAD
jgi:hypothetical protein